MRWWPILPFALLLAAALAAPAAADEERHEVLRYRWRLQGLRGALAGLFFPNHGHGSLVTSESGGRARSELLITSEEGLEGEFWRYGAELDTVAGRTVRAWSAYLFRGERKSKETELGDAGVVDVASGILMIRRELPESPVRMRIWSDGKLYPVVVIPMGEEARRLPIGRVAVRHYSVRGVELPGERVWKGRLELWLAKDDEATPVEILVERAWAGVRLEIESSL